MNHVRTINIKELFTIIKVFSFDYDTDIDLKKETEAKEGYL